MYFRNEECKVSRVKEQCNTRKCDVAHKFSQHLVGTFINVFIVVTTQTIGH